MIVQLIQRAQAAQRGGDTGAARSLYEQALALDGTQAAALNGMGMLALRSGDPSATAWFERATAADAGAGPLWLNLASARRAGGDTAGEQAALESALALDQRNVMANYRLAELFDRSGEPMAAMPRWQGLVAMLGNIGDLSPELQRVRATAQGRVAAHGAELGATIETAMAAGRERLDGRDRRRLDRCVDAMLGRRRIHHNDCHGLHFPFLPADEFFDRAHFPWITALEAETPAILAEYQALRAAPNAGFVPYVDMAEGSPDNCWSPLDRSADWSARYLWRFGVRDDAVCERCPRTAAAIEAVPRVSLAGQAPTAFFSVLAPGTRLPAHTGVSNIRAIVHLPLIVPDGCGFRVGGETRSWQVGEAFAFDDTIEHEAWNTGDAPRAVLILDVWNPHIENHEREMLQTLFDVLARSGSDSGSGLASGLGRAAD